MRTFVVLFALLLAGCSEPFVTLPGGALSGEPTPAPADWSALESIETIQVEFRPDDPYSHNIWGVGIGADLYIATSADGTRWTPMVAADPRVRARVGTSLYDLNAMPVTDADERARVAAAYQKKYDIDPSDNWVDDALVYRLDRR
jgi:hypothetical protein